MLVIAQAVDPAVIAAAGISGTLQTWGPFGALLILLGWIVWTWGIQGQRDTIRERDAEISARREELRALYAKLDALNEKRREEALTALADYKDVLAANNAIAARLDAGMDTLTEMLEAALARLK